MDLLLSTPFNFAQTLAAARAVLFSPNSTTLYRLPSRLMTMPLLISAVFAMKKNFVQRTPLERRKDKIDNPDFKNE
jgi:hypothetical protein